MLARLFHAVCVATLAAMVASCGIFGPSDNETVTIEGTVYGTTVNNPSGGPVSYVSPVNGGVVSTSLDSTTALTDASGKFKLVTTTGPAKEYGCKVYTVTITAAGWPSYTRSGVWGSHPQDQVFALTQGWPEFVGAGITPC